MLGRQDLRIGRLQAQLTRAGHLDRAAECQDHLSDYVHVDNARDIVQDTRLVGQQRGDHVLWQRVLRATHMNLPVQRGPTAYSEALLLRGSRGTRVLPSCEVDRRHRPYGISRGVAPTPRGVHHARGR